MNNFGTKVIFLIAIFILFGTPSFSDDLYGTGNNFGSGWQSDSRGGYRGTGDNFGSGWRR